MTEIENTLQIARAFETGREGRGYIGYYPTNLEALQTGLATGEFPLTHEDNLTFMLTDPRYTQIDSYAFQKARERAISKSAADQELNNHPRGLVILISKSFLHQNSINPFINPGEWATVEMKSLPIDFVAGIEPIGQEETDFLYELQHSVDRSFAQS